ncbi:MAG: hypothetical protein ACKO96_30500, partial [Flammeovirgaceae bacterium]
CLCPIWFFPIEKIIQKMLGYDDGFFLALKINESMSANEEIPYRIYGVDFERKKKPVIIPKHFLNYFLYRKKPNWTKTQKITSVLKSA